MHWCPPGNPGRKLHAPRGFCSERWHNLVIPLTGFSRNVFVLVRKELALHRDKLRTSSPAEGRDCAEACICTAELALSLPNGRSVEIEIDTAATAEGSGQPGCGPAAQGGKGPLPDENCTSIAP